MLTADPDARISAQEALDHPWLSNLEDSRVEATQLEIEEEFGKRLLNQTIRITGPYIGSVFEISDSEVEDFDNN